MLLSIITIVRNDPAGLRAVFDELARQTFTDFEHIVVNGGVDTETDHLIEEHRGRVGVLIKEPDRGISDAFNKGARVATGDVLLFLNAGDGLVSPDTLAKAMEVIGNSPTRRRSIFYGDYIYCGLEMEQRVATSVAGLQKGNSLNHQSLFVGVETMRAFPYDLRFKITMDYDVWLRCRAAGVAFVRLDMAVARFREGGISSSVKWLPYNLMSKESCRFLNNVYPTYRWRDIAVFFIRSSWILFRARLKDMLGPRFLVIFRRIKFGR